MKKKLNIRLCQHCGGIAFETRLCDACRIRIFSKDVYRKTVDRTASGDWRPLGDGNYWRVDHENISLSHNECFL